MTLKNKLLSSSGAAAADLLAIEDVFSTYLYTGNGLTQTITNGIDLAGEGGLVWIKSRSVARSHNLFDSERVGVGYKVLFSDTTGAEADPVNRVTAFNADGFTMSASTAVNASTEAYASWTFRKAPRFFDVVTYTGNGVAGRQIAHNLGVVPGCIIVKRTDGVASWATYHRSLGGTKYLTLNTTDAAATNNGAWNDTNPTDAVFTVGDGGFVNIPGGTYVAYLFAHDPLGPSGDGSDGLIACGSYTGNGSANGPEINLGWEPQWLLVKRSDSAENWFMLDIMRGITTGGADPWLNPNTSGAEFITTDDYVDVTATGFKLKRSTGEFNANGSIYLYIAIRRGPMRPPESGSEVFAIDDWSSTVAPTFISGFPVDMALYRPNVSGANSFFANTRLLGQSKLNTSSTSAEVFESTSVYDFMNGWHNPTGFGPFSNYYSWMFRRAPEFFDVVAYTGDGVAGRTVPHNLGVAPELMIVKARNNSAHWAVYYGDPTAYMFLNSTNGATTSSSYWNNTAPSSTVFTLGTTSATNVSSAYTYIAYLFASKAGVSKVGSYTGNGTSQTIDCGFTAGARFILIKRTDSTGDWYVWDTARGIVAANDPHLSLNTTAAEVTTDDSVDPASVGFIVNQVAATNINVNAASYIFLAIA